MIDARVQEEQTLKRQILKAVEAHDWQQARALAIALVQIYEDLLGQLGYTEAKPRWQGLREKWLKYVERFGQLSTQAVDVTAAEGPEKPPAVEHAVTTPQTVPDPQKAAQVLQVTPAPPSGPDLRKAARVLGVPVQAVRRESPPGDSRPEPDADATKPATGTSEWLLRERPSVTFDDIVGLDDLKQRVKRFVVKFKHPDEVAKWKGARLGDRMLLLGPPGTGKTMFAKAVAHEIDADFFLVKGSNVLSKWVGESQKNVAKLFEEVRKCERAVVFLDEIEGLLPKRGGSSSVRDGVVTEFLQEMDGLSSPNSRVLFIGATNLPSELDIAAVSRFGTKFYVPLPEKAARLALLSRGFAAFPYGVEPDVSVDQLADRLDRHSMRAVQRVVDDLIDIGILKSAEGTPYRIAQPDVEEVLRTLAPPISQRELAKYEELARG